MEEKLRLAREAYDCERLLEVHRLLDGIDDTSSDDWIRRAKKEASDATKMYAALVAGGGLESESKDWAQCVDAKGIGVRYRPEAKSRFASVCVSARELPRASLVLTVTNEVSLLSNFMPAFLGFQAQTLEQISRFRQIVWMRVRLPPPFAPRDVIFDAQGVDCLREPQGGIMILVRTPDPKDFPDLDAPPDKRNGYVVRAKVILAAALIKPHDHNTSSLVNIMNVDPVLPALPGWLFDFVNRNIVWYAFDAFRTQVNKLGEQKELPDDYRKLVDDKKDLYDELKKRLEPWETEAKNKA